MKKIVVLSNRKNIFPLKNILKLLFNLQMFVGVQKDKVLNILAQENTAYLFLNLMNIEEKNTPYETIKYSSSDERFNAIVFENLRIKNIFKKAPLPKVIET
ncbi:MAG: hypothetical protein AUK34_08025 [Ignavibacteria bacterium CG2_30_36_16]|nr:hypothetical protein [Ignavibacteria bacterium]OIP59334.1 MAG: hypothetical protein AUK34_08025 [Ignavibacteria bacterium CG2_30_36_16]